VETGKLLLKTGNRGGNLMETMSLKALANKVLQGNRKGNPVETEIKKVETLARENGNSGKLIELGKLKPLPDLDNETLNERMAIMGENCEPEQVEPFVTDFGVLVIPFNSDKKYHYWKGGQSVCDTLKELGRCDLVEKYKSPYCN
jgi:hypothetical protein